MSNVLDIGSAAASQIMTKDGDGGGEGNDMLSLSVTKAENGWIVNYTIYNPEIEDLQEFTEVYNKDKEAVQSLIDIMGLQNSVKLK